MVTARLEGGVSVWQDSPKQERLLSEERPKIIQTITIKPNIIYMVTDNDPRLLHLNFKISDFYYDPLILVS